MLVNVLYGWCLLQTKQLCHSLVVRESTYFAIRDKPLFISKIYICSSMNMTFLWPRHHRKISHQPPLKTKIFFPRPPHIDPGPFPTKTNDWSLNTAKHELRS